MMGRASSPLSRTSRCVLTLESAVHRHGADCADTRLCAWLCVGLQVVMVETSFTLDPKKQFDQAGIVIRIDSEHWIKTG